MARALWTGSVSFGLVNVPVKLYTAVRPRDIRFRMLHDRDLAPIRHRMVCPIDGREVPPEHRLRGYEIRKDHYLIITDEDLEAAAPEKSKSIHVEDFVDPGEIEPLFFQRTYYVGPGTGGQKLYALLVQALKKTRKVGIARFVMRGTTYLGALRAVGDALRIYLMRFADEIVPADEIDGADIKVKLNEREVKMAQGLIDSLSASFDASRYEDEYTGRVMELIQRKARGEEVSVKPAKDLVATPSRNLLKMLQESIKHAKSADGARSGRAARSRRRPAAAAAAEKAGR